MQIVDTETVASLPLGWRIVQWLGSGLCLLGFISGVTLTAIGSVDPETADSTHPYAYNVKGKGVRYISEREEQLASIASPLMLYLFPTGFVLLAFLGRRNARVNNARKQRLLSG